MSSNERFKRRLIERLETLHAAGVLQLPKLHRHTYAPPSAVAIDQSSASSVVDPAIESNEPLERTATAVAADLKSMVKKHSRIQPPQESPELKPPTLDNDPCVKALQILQDQVAGCTRCQELANTRTHTVFGVGTPKARLCFLGEAPGADEDLSGIPFVGRAGQLLTKIIEACRLTRDDVYILNMIKCRPPGNRNPLPAELTNCREYLEKQLDLIRPEFICCLGAVASQNLLGTTVSIGKLRGKIHTFRGLKVVCTYHPAFLLRSPSFKKETWDDMKMLMREMGMEV